MYVSKLTIIGSDNGFLLDQHQASIWTSAEILLIGPLGTSFREILNRIQIFSFKIQENAFKYAVCEMASILSRLPCVKLTLQG